MGVRPDTITSSLMFDLAKSNLCLSDWQSMDSRSVAASLLVKSVFKKYTPSQGPATRAAAIAKFRDVNSSVPVLRVHTLDKVTQRVLHHARRIISSLFVDSEGYEPTIEAGRFGPGSVMYAGNAFSSKISGEVAFCGSASRNFWLRAALCEPVSRTQELKRIRAHGFKEVKWGNLTTVPKTDKTDRVICVEPTANAYLQQAIARDLELRLKRLGLDITKQQPIQKYMARMGSISGEFSTIDLSSASDSIGITLVRDLFPAAVFEWLLAARTPCALVDKELVPLRMMSSMGNATTFPVQTIIFSALVAGCYNELGLQAVFKPHSRFDGASRRFSPVFRNAGVFGDDIIVKSSVFPLLCDVLHNLGMKVNPDKSFNDGYFRESCGGDYHLGMDVRPVHIQSLETRNDLFIAYNQLRRWSRKTGIPLPETLRVIRRSVAKPLFVPLWENDDAGFHCDSGPTRYTASRPRSTVKILEDCHLAYVVWLSGRSSAAVWETDLPENDPSFSKLLEPIRLPKGKIQKYREKSCIAWSYTIPPAQQFAFEY